MFYIIGLTQLGFELPHSHRVWCVGQIKLQQQKISRTQLKWDSCESDTAQHLCIERQCLREQSQLDPIRPFYPRLENREQNREGGVYPLELI